MYRDTLILAPVEHLLKIGFEENGIVSSDTRKVNKVIADTK